MKKLTAILLAVLLLISLASLAACTDAGTDANTNTDTNPDTDANTNTDTNTDTDTHTDADTVDLDSTKNNELVPEKLAAGWPMHIDWSLSNDAYFTHTQLGDAAEDMFVEAGFTRGVIYSGGGESDLAAQMVQLENLATSASADKYMCGICVQTMDPNAIQPMIEALQEGGVTIVLYGIMAEYPTIISMTDTYQAGYGASVMARDWAATRYPGETVKCCVQGSQVMAPLVMLTQGMLDGVEEFDNLALGFYGDNDGGTHEAGYDGAEAAMLTDPDIRIFIDYQMAAGLGVNNYLMAAGYDLSEFGIFGTSEDDTTAQMLESAGNNDGTSAFRGTISAGAGTADTIAKTMMKSLLEEAIPLGTIVVDPMYAWTSSDYVCDFTIGDVSDIAK